jgi:hypothetical protein
MLGVPKFCLWALGCISLAGCSYSDFVPVAPPISAPALEPTWASSPLPSATATSASLLMTATFTATPTLVQMSSSPVATQTTFAAQTGIPLAIGTPLVQSIGTPDAIFVRVQITSGSIFWGICKPDSSTVDVKVADPVAVHRVLLALRLQGKKTGDTTPWGGYAIMNDEGQGTFTYRLTARSFSHYGDYLSAWGQMQLIALDRLLRVVGRSSQFLQTLSLAPCS